MGSPAVAARAPTSEPDTSPGDEAEREVIHYLPVDRDEGEIPYTPIPRSVPLSSEGDEWELIDRAKAGDQEAIDRILTAFYPIVPKAIRDKLPQVEKGTGLYADLYHDGIRVLREAVETFDHDRDTRFGVYARQAVRNTLVDAWQDYTSVVTVNREYRRFQRKFKKAESAAWAVNPRGAWYGEVALQVADEAREEIVRVWRQLFPNDPPPDPLWPWDADIGSVVQQLGERAERANRIITCVGVLKAGLNATAHPADIDDSEKVQSDGWIAETVSRHELIADPTTELHAGEDPDTTRTRQEARSRLLGKLAEAADLPRQQAYTVMATLGLDGKGSRTPEEIAAELSDLKGSEVRPDSVQRSLQRAAGRIWEAMISPAGSILDPYLSEPEFPELEIVDPFEVAEAEREAAKRQRYFDAFTAVEKEAAERWEKTRREKTPPAVPTEDDVHDALWTDPNTGGRCRSAPRITCERLTGGRAVHMPSDDDSEAWRE